MSINFICSLFLMLMTAACSMVSVLLARYAVKLKEALTGGGLSGFVMQGKDYSTSKNLSKKRNFARD